jgi:hypothetical protein
MKRVLIAVVALLAAWQIAQRGDFGERDSSRARESQTSAAPSQTAAVERSDDAVESAYEQQRSSVQVEVHGVISKLLKDDDEGSRHQRFIVRLDSGLTVLVAHNIDLAPRVEGLRTGDAVSVFGEYEWNHKGGVIHWTHRDPAGRHVAGWIRHDGRAYQ